MSRVAIGWTTAGVGAVAIAAGTGFPMLTGGGADAAGASTPALWAALAVVMVGMVAVGVGVWFVLSTLIDSADRDIWLRPNPKPKPRPRPVLGLPDADGVWTHRQVLDWLPVSAEVRATLGRGEGR